MLFASVATNSKVGHTYTWSIEAEATCPGSTEACREVCYAKRLATRRANVRNAWAARTALTERPDFTEILTAALAMLPAGLLRIHVSGDFYSVEYIHAWATSLKENPHIHPWAYTRSWRVPELRAAFQTAFGKIPQWLLASTDRDTGAPPEGWREATMLHEVRKPHKRPVLASAAPSVFICPQQTQSQPDCASCGACGGHRIDENGDIQVVGKLPKKIGFAIH